LPEAPETGNAPFPTAPVGGRAKRLMDLAVTVPLAIALSPALGAVALWIRRDSPGPALYRQSRVGLMGRPFTLLKFRTMVVGAESMGTGLRVSADDPRITRAGRALRALSLDELPQIWNVLRGDMSLVGPRPTVASQVAHYTARQRRRLAARPGLTGLAQVRGRNAIPWSARIEIDVEYVERWSLGLDLRVLARTVGVVLGRGGTYIGEAGGFDLPKLVDELTTDPLQDERRAPDAGAHGG
jgi:lipopolysaccharide/colanic/teichoic acid biosynthesis glycosyltransferase